MIYHLKNHQKISDINKFETNKIKNQFNMNHIKLNNKFKKN
jgi:hypothetical protein